MSATPPTNPHPTNPHGQDTSSPGSPGSAGSADGEPVDDRSAMALAIDKVSQITAASLALVVPTLIGYGLDRWLKTGVVLTCLGFAFGAIAGTWQLYKLVQRLE